jgi:hypothetical protein
MDQYFFRPWLLAPRRVQAKEEQADMSIEGVSSVFVSQALAYRRRFNGWTGGDMPKEGKSLYREN